MSYDLAFWKQKQGTTDQPAGVYQQLLENGASNSAETIPMEEIIDRIRQAFSGITEAGGLVFWEGDDRGMFELVWSQQHMHCCCRQSHAEEMNRLIEIIHEYGCPLYDPQVDKRFG